MAGSLTSRRDLDVLRALARRLNPADAGAHNNLGVLYFNKGLLDDAAAMFGRALELQPRLRVARRNLEVLHSRPEFAERRLAELRDAVLDAPDSRGPRMELGRAYLLAGRYEAAVAEFAELLARDPSDVEAMLQAGLAVAADGDLADAQRWFEHAQRLAPERSDVHLALGELLYNRGLTEGALTTLQRAVELDDENADAHHLLGFVLGDLGRHEAARAATGRALALNPAMGRPEGNLSLEAPAAQRPGAPARTAAEVRRGGRGSAHGLTCNGAHLAHFNLGLAFRHKGYLAEAAREYQLALERGEERSLVLQALAEVRLLQRDTVGAVALYDELLAGAPHSPKLWNERGVALHQAGRVADAQASYAAAVEADAGYALALNNLGVALSHLGRTSEAEAALTAAVREEPGFVRAHLNLALLLTRTDRASEARECYRRAVALDPEQPVAWNGLGRSFLDQRQFLDARPAFARAIQARPDYAEAYYNLGFTLSNLGDFDGALAATRRALELDPFYVSQRFELAIDLEYESPDLSVLPELEAEQRGSGPVDAFSFDAAALDALVGSLAPRSGSIAAVADPGAIAPAEQALALLERGDTFALRGLHGEALERYEQALALAPSLDAAQHGSIRSLLALGRVQLARERLDQLLVGAPDDPELLVMAADAALAAGYAAEGLRLAQTAVGCAPGRADGVQRVGDALLQLGDEEGAMEAYRETVALEPDRAAVRRVLATLLARAGFPAAAEEHLRHALGTLPTYAAAALDLAVLLRDMARPGEARMVLLDAMRRDPYDLAALGELAELLLEDGQVGDAQVAVERALRLDPEHAGALYVQGLLHARQHRMRDALACWHAAIAADVTGRVGELARRAAAHAGDSVPLGLVA